MVTVTVMVRFTAAARAHIRARATRTHIDICTYPKRVGAGTV